MNSQALLDYALFQLTPTRTRFDLVVFCGGRSEKLAFGLVEPFISHLKFAKDQIPKGGYSITLRPSTSSTHLSWFSKATFQRFLRFVSTPEILERSISIEREILQIESSIQSNNSTSRSIAGHRGEGSLLPVNGLDKKERNSTKLNGEARVTDDVEQEENCKIRLRRRLDTRKALLQKEQAMVYARAIVAGFENDNLDDLIHFADAFGASRLREACINFKELCKKKSTDGLWINGLAAVEACSSSELSYSQTPGIILTCEGAALGTNNASICDPVNSTSEPQARSDSNRDNNYTASDQIPSASAKGHVQVPWPNQIPQYMYNFKKSFQQKHSTHYHPFHSMFPVPPYYPGSIQWPPNNKFNPGLIQTTDPMKVKNSHTSEEDGGTESADSISRHDEDSRRKHCARERLHRKKHRKNSSKTVVIRNINYFTSKKTSGDKDTNSSYLSSVDDDLLDEDSVKQEVEDISVTKSHCSTKHILNEDPVPNACKGGETCEDGDAFESNGNQMRKETSIHLHAESSLMNGSGSGSVFAISQEFESEKVPTHQKIVEDSCHVTQRDHKNGTSIHFEELANYENVHPTMMRSNYGDEQILFLQKPKEPCTALQVTPSDSIKESSTIKQGNEEDWFIVNHLEISENQDTTMEKTTYDGTYTMSLESNSCLAERNIKAVVDDSFLVQRRSEEDDLYDSQWITDRSIVLDLNVDPHQENDISDVHRAEVSDSCEPEDLCMILARYTGLDSAEAPWTPEIDYRAEISFTEPDKKYSVVEANDHTAEKFPVIGKNTNSKKSVVPGINKLGKEAVSRGLQRSQAKSKPDTLSKEKKQPHGFSKPMIKKSKLEKEEEMRKKKEELIIQRQKRISERTAANGLTAISYNVPAGGKITSLKLNSSKVGMMNSASLAPGQIKHRGLVC